MKKFLIALLIVFVVLIAASAIGRESTNTKSVSKDNSENISDQVSAKSAPRIENGTVGDYVVKVKEAKVVKNGDDNILIVTYSYTNNSDEAKAFLHAVDDHLFQNGIELGTVYSSWGIKDNYNFENKSKQIKPGVTLDVQCAYKLNDTTSNVDVEISKTFSSDNKIVYTISLK